jgi:hypothetical protein
LSSLNRALREKFGVLNENFWAYIDEHCPEPSWVREAVGNPQLPSVELEDLFKQAAAKSG